MSKKLHVGNLSSSATVADLKALFGQFGDVEFVNIAKNAQTGLSSGFGCVQMTSNTDAKTAINKLNYTNFDDLILSVRMID